MQSSAPISTKRYEIQFHIKTDLPIDEQDERLSHRAPKPGGQRPRGGAEELGEPTRELGQPHGVERRDVGQERGAVAEVLGDGGVGGDAADGGEAEGGLLLEELERGVELAVDEAELRLVPLRVALHLRLERRQAQLLGAPAGRRQGLQREVGGRHRRRPRARCRGGVPSKTLEPENPRAWYGCAVFLYVSFFFQLTNLLYYKIK